MLTPPIRAKRALLAALVATSSAVGSTVAAQPASARPSYSCPPSAHDNDPNPLHIESFMLTMLNKERAAHGAPGLGSDPRLRLESAGRHNAQMARFDRLSHRLPGEAGLVPRIMSTGFRSWTVAGENVAMNTDETWRGACYLQNWMYHETGPNDGHRRNILNPAYRRVGINVLMDRKHHTMWITFDFFTTGRA